MEFAGQRNAAPQNPVANRAITTIIATCITPTPGLGKAQPPK
jgi:hypothetical protein